MGPLTGLPGSDSIEFGLKEYDPLKLSANEEWLPWFREAEIKHGRIAMLGALGFVFAEFFQLPGDVHQVSSVGAHSAAVTSGSLQQILLW